MFVVVCLMFAVNGYCRRLVVVCCLFVAVVVVLCLVRCLVYVLVVSWLWCFVCLFKLFVVCCCCR